MLDDPEAKHDLAVHIPDGHLLTGHVIDLAALLSKKRGAAWSTRLVMVLFMLGAAFVYARLWNIYRDERPIAVEQVSFHQHGAYLRRECLQYMILPIAAILMWLLLLLAATLNDDMFWDALVR